MPFERLNCSFGCISSVHVNVLDQCRAFFLGLIPVQQPEKREQGSEQQDDAEFGQRQQPA